MPTPPAVTLISTTGSPLPALPPATARPRALLTGVSSGVGRGLASALAPDYQLICCGRDTQRLQEVLAELPGSGHCGLLADLALATTFPSLPSLDRLDLLVHSAGISPVGEIHRSPRSDWEDSYAINVLALVELVSRYRTALIASGGRIIALNSGSGITAHPGMGAYCASKFALRAVTDALRQELPECTVTSIHPGRIDTPMQEGLVAAQGGEYVAADYLSVDTVVAAIRATLDIGPEASLNEIILRPRSSYGYHHAAGRVGSKRHRVS